MFHGLGGGVTTSNASSLLVRLQSSSLDDGSAPPGAPHEEDMDAINVLISVRSDPRRR